MRKLFIAGVVAVMVFASAAFAASLTVADSTLASGEGDVVSCATGDVTVSYQFNDAGSAGPPEWDSVLGDWVVNEAVLDLTGCDGESGQFRLEIDGVTSSAFEGGQTFTVSGGAATVTFSSIEVERISGHAILVNG